MTAPTYDDLIAAVATQAVDIERLRYDNEALRGMLESNEHDIRTLLRANPSITLADHDGVRRPITEYQTQRDEARADAVELKRLLEQARRVVDAHVGTLEQVRTYAQEMFESWPNTDIGVDLLAILRGPADEVTE